MQLKNHIKGNKIGWIAIGSGSDCIQAAVLAKLDERPACIISIHPMGNEYQDYSSAECVVHNHNGELYEGVYRINPETLGYGRFYEHIPANDMRVFYVLHTDRVDLTDQIQAALSDYSHVDTVVAVDTGGDVLYPFNAQPVLGYNNQSVPPTPDQDLKSLMAINSLYNVKKMSLVVATGVDAPPNYQDVLINANAIYLSLDEESRKKVLRQYYDYEFDGSNLARYGVISFAWQAALRGETGAVQLPIPAHLTSRSTNPINPTLEISAEMGGIYIMNLENHVRAINSRY